MLYRLSYLPNPDVRAESREPRLRSAASPEGSSESYCEAKNEGYGTEIAPECQVELP